MAFILCSKLLTLRLVRPILHAIREKTQSFYFRYSPGDSASDPEVGHTARFRLRVKGTPGAGKWSRICDADAEAASRLSRRPTGGPGRQ